jgi:hypothetical protein
MSEGGFVSKDISQVDLSAPEEKVEKAALATSDKTGSTEPGKTTPPKK